MCITDVKLTVIQWDISRVWWESSVTFGKQWTKE